MKSSTELRFQQIPEEAHRVIEIVQFEILEIGGCGLLAHTVAMRFQVHAQFSDAETPQVVMTRPAAIELCI